MEDKYLSPNSVALNADVCKLIFLIQREIFFMFMSSVHLSIIHTRLVLSRVTVLTIWWSLSQLSPGKRQGCTLDSSPVHQRVTCNHMWEEAEVSGENPHKHEENMQTPEGKLFNFAVQS